MSSFLVRRMWAHRLLVAAALFTVTLTSCALTALSVYGDAVADAGLRRVLQERSAARTLLEAEADVDTADPARSDALVRRVARDAYDGLPVRVASSTRSGPYQLPDDGRQETDGTGETGGGDARLTLLATLDASRVSLASGTRPGPVGEADAVPVAVPEEAARALDLRPGDRMTLADRRRGTPLRIRVTGVYRPADRNDPYWRLDPLAGRGVRTVDFTTYGPLLVDPSAFTDGRVAPAVVSWQARADFSTVTADRADRLRESVNRAVKRLGDDPAAGGIRADTELPALLDETERSLRASRSTLLMGMVELAVLAGCATVLVAGALYESRAGENALLRARGGTGRRLVALTAGEALLLAVPAAVVAALAAGPLVALTAEHGALAEAGVRVSRTADGRTWAVACAVALGCAAVLTAPSLRRHGSYVRERAARIRRPALGATVRAGADVALLAVAAVAYARLARHADGDGALAAGGGLFGVDPFLVVAPACCLLAGAVPAVRLLPVVVWAFRWAVDRTRGLVLAGAHWQLSRRPGRAAGPLLLGVLAVATATFAAGQGASWDRSQQDQADHAVGADLRITESSTPAFGQGGAYDEVAGIASATPVVRERVTLSSNRTATLLAMDADRAPDVMRPRRDPTDRPDDPYATLRSETRRDSGIALPSDAQRLRVTVRLRAADGGKDVEGPRENLGAVVEDRYGVPRTFALGELPADGEPHVLELDFATAAGPAGAPAGPLRLTRLTAGHALPDSPVELRLTVTDLRAVTEDGETTEVTVPEDAAWRARAEVDDPDFRASPERGLVDVHTSDPAVARDGAVLDVRYGSGAQPPPGPGGEHHRAELALYAADTSRARPAAVATDAFLEARGARVGDTATIEVRGTPVEIRVTGAVRTLPTTSPRDEGTEGGALLMDLGTLQDALWDRFVPGPQPGEWWLAVEPGEVEAVAAALRDRPDDVSLLVRDESARELASDPLGAGPRSALSAVALAAAVLAAAGFAVVTVGALRERAVDFAVLRALGAPRSRIAAAVAVEQGFLAVAAVGLGAAAGSALTHLIVPLTVVTARASRPEPEVGVVFPDGLATVLAAVVVAVPAVVAAVVAARRERPTDVLRKVED
ncbi:FtsX-like permease family protein [Streptomyces megasporus]|uniref:FtsX-like permease family protein n=1 Tax=Streptomyces megasporus TaxID=44060 RepID=UPI00056A4C44|nr:FtsX-like permease family protein [Streptomyces megasporus]